MPLKSTISLLLAVGLAGCDTSPGQALDLAAPDVLDSTEVPLPDLPAPVDPGPDSAGDASGLLTPLFGHPHDGRLYAAAGSAIITPTPGNHPCTVYLAGTGRNRLSMGVHDDLTARALLLEQDGVHFVLVELDLVGLTQGDVQRFQDALASHQVDRDRVVIEATHTHAGPDTLGI